jgi:hypothetical protein
VRRFRDGKKDRKQGRLRMRREKEEDRKRKEMSRKE